MDAAVDEASVRLLTSGVNGTKLASGSAYLYNASMSLWPVSMIAFSILISLTFSFLQLRSSRSI